MPSRRTLLKSGLSLTIASAFSPTVRSWGNTSVHLNAGSGKADVALEHLYPIDEFVGQHDPISIRVVLLDNGIHRQAIAILDLTSLSSTVIHRMKSILQKMANVPFHYAVIGASHNFSTPHVAMNDTSETAQHDKVLAAFEKAMTAATQQALSTLQPAQIAAGSGYCRIGVNRNIDTPFGWWLGNNDAGFHDPQVGIVRINGRDNNPIAILVNYAVQPAVMDASERKAGGRLASADFAGAMSRQVEQYFGGNTVVPYLVGAAGDQVPYLQAARHTVDHKGKASRIDIHEAGFELVDLFGQRLAAEVIRVAHSLETESTSRLSLSRQAIHLRALSFSPRNAPTGPVTSFTYTPDGTTSMPIILMDWGGIAVVAVQPELSASLGEHIRSESPYAHTLVITMADGAAKYLPDTFNFDHFTYEARSSPFAQGAGEDAAALIIAKLHQMKGTTA